MSVKIFKKSCLALVCAYAATSASALDLLQAYEAALTQDATYHAARLAADAGRENLPQARAQLMPSVSAAFSRNRNLLDTISPNSLGQLADSRANYPSNSNSVTLRQPIYRRYQWAQYQQAQAQVDDVNAVLDFSTQNLAVNVAGAFFDALLAGEQLALIATQLENYRTQLDAARKIFEAGSGTRTDIDEVQSRLDMSVAQELEARQNVDYTRQQLQVFVNQPVDSLSAVDVSKLELLSPVPTSAEAWVERAEQASPELRVLRARVEQSRFEVEKARAGHYPTLDAVAQWSRNGSENNQSINTTYESRSVGLQLNVPIFAGGGVSSTVRQAVANEAKAAQQLEAGRRDLSVRVLKEFRGVTEGVLKVRAMEQAVRSSEQTLLSSQKSFQAGSRTRLDILNAQSNRMVALRDLAQARYMYLMATLRLKALAGEADIAAVAAINANFQP
jgi:TolC family type I secretion outer membrane protein